MRLSDSGRALPGPAGRATTAAVERPSGAITAPQAAGDDSRGPLDGVPQPIRASRRQLGLSTAAVAAAVGVARTTAWEWEVGHRPIPSARQAALAALLRVAPALLEARPAPTPRMKEPHMPVAIASNHSRQNEVPARAPEPNAQATGQAPPRQAATHRRRTVVMVELACLLCSREVGTLECATWPTSMPVQLRRPETAAVVVDDWHRLRCRACGGTVLPTEVTHQTVRSDSAVDWLADQPRRGRPPRWLAVQRQSAGTIA